MYAEEAKESTRYFHTRNPKVNSNLYSLVIGSVRIFFPIVLFSMFLFFGVNFSDTSGVPIHLELFHGKTNFKQNSQLGDSIHVQIG